MAFGFSQFSLFLIFAALFYVASVLQENIEGLEADNIFIAIFAMMLGAMQAGQA